VNGKSEPLPTKITDELKRGKFFYDVRRDDPRRGKDTEEASRKKKLKRGKDRWTASLRYLN